MPRIAARTEPYADPTRQQRHFKTKRDQALRALGKASYVNGSHFAILFVSAKGTPESYGTPLFQDKLNVWFNATVTSEAITLVRNASKRNHPGPDTQTPTKRNRDDDRGIQSTNSSPAGSANHRDESSPSSTSPANSITTTSTFPFAAPSAPIHTPLLEAPGNSDGRFRQAEAPFTPTTSPQQARRLPRSSEHDASSDPSDQRYLDIFSRIQQHTCKIICKSWIKVIEPKKQTRYPYQGEDQTKPDWWPKNIRHKEPDHLVTAERQGVMLAILKKVIRRNPAEDRMGNTSLSVAKLELNTAEVMVHIPPEKHDLLKELYQTAKEDEKKWLAGSAQDLTSRPVSSNNWDKSAEQDVNKNPHSYPPASKNTSSVHIPRCSQNDENLGTFPFYEERRTETNVAATPRTAGTYETRMTQYPMMDRSSNRFHPYYTPSSATYLGTSASRGDFVSAPTLIPPPVHQDTPQSNYTYSSISHNPSHPFSSIATHDFEDDEHDFADDDADGDFPPYVTSGGNAGSLGDAIGSNFGGLTSVSPADAPRSTASSSQYNVVYKGHWMLPVSEAETSLHSSQPDTTETGGGRSTILDSRLTNSSEDRSTFLLATAPTVSSSSSSSTMSNPMAHHQLNSDFAATDASYYTTTPTVQSYQTHQRQSLSIVTPMHPSPSQASTILTPCSSASSLSAESAPSNSSQLPTTSHPHYTSRQTTDYPSSTSAPTIATAKPSLRLQATHELSREMGLVPMNVPSSASHQTGFAGWSSGWPINESV
ncbi:hypothetical protein FRC02_002265 [Tulasnella sp. 418]|nr:hypothetical protein FRC02_002265 [Tulasnella sp. 418]